jgi:hypothetical protein
MRGSDRHSDPKGPAVVRGRRSRDVNTQADRSASRMLFPRELSTRHNASHTQCAMRCLQGGRHESANRALLFRRRLVSPGRGRTRPW